MDFQRPVRVTVIVLIQDTAQPLFQLDLVWLQLERSQAKTMNDEDIARLTIPELIELIRRLLDEVEVRSMELT